MPRLTGQAGTSPATAPTGHEVGVEIGDGLVDNGAGNLEALGSYVVELFPVVECRRHAVVPNGGDHGGDCG